MVIDQNEEMGSHCEYVGKLIILEIMENEEMDSLNEQDERMVLAANPEKLKK